MDCPDRLVYSDMSKTRSTGYYFRFIAYWQGTVITT